MPAPFCAIYIDLLNFYKKPSEAVFIHIPQRREPRSCEMTYLALGHPARKWWSWDSCLAVWLQSLHSCQLCAGRKNRRRLVSAPTAFVCPHLPDEAGETSIPWARC